MSIRPDRGLIRAFYSRLYNSGLQLFFHTRIGDHQCGFKAFKKSVLLDLIEEMGYDFKFRRGWFWDAELLIRAQRRSYKIDEFPVKWKSGNNSTFSLRRELKMIPYIIQLKSKLG